jgi:hypothetical protein
LPAWCGISGTRGGNAKTSLNKMAALTPIHDLT